MNKPPRREAIATRVEAIAARVEAVAARVEAIASRVEAIATRVEAVATRVDLEDSSSRKSRTKPVTITKLKALKPEDAFTAKWFSYILPYQKSSFSRVAFGPPSI